MIQIEYGLVEGISKNGCTVYMGIPFAKPPIGELAFRHPVKPEAWNDILVADHGSRNPIQSQSGFFTGNNDLDCLYLNIFVPDHEENQVLPVMVWIYGGSYAQGGAGAVSYGSQELNYDFTEFAKATKSIIVSFNYRLNLYGFLNLSFLDDSFDRNNGLYDQIMAIRFVKDNIASFGGDSTRITLFGQSAGGACILALMCMEESEGLFHQAIIQSACIEHFFSEDESHANTKLYLKKAGFTDLSKLSAITQDQVTKVNDAYSSAFIRKTDIRCAFSPVIDGITLKQEPKRAVQKSLLPMLIGNTQHESNLFIQKIPTIALPVIAKLLHLRPVKEDAPYRQRISDALTDHIYVRPQLEILNGYCGSAWRYEYSHSIEGSNLGSCHASELSFLFGRGRTIDNMAIPKEDAAGKIMQNIWRQFAWNGDPGWICYQSGKHTEVIK